MNGLTKSLMKLPASKNNIQQAKWEENTKNIRKPLILALTKLTFSTCVFFSFNVLDVLTVMVPILVPDAIVGPTPLRLQSAWAADSIFPRLKIFRKAFFVSCITTRGVFIWTKLTMLAWNLPRCEKTGRWGRSVKKMVAETKQNYSLLLY